jgi:hypothetical protein
MNSSTASDIADPDPAAPQPSKKSGLKHAEPARAVPGYANLFSVRAYSFVARGPLEVHDY